MSRSYFSLGGVTFVEESMSLSRLNFSLGGVTLACAANCEAQYCVLSDSRARCSLSTQRVTRACEACEAGAPLAPLRVRAAKSARRNREAHALLAVALTVA